MTIAERIAKRIADSGLSNEQIAAAMQERGHSIGAWTVRVWRNAERAPRSEYFDALCEILQLTTAELVT